MPKTSGLEASPLAPSPLPPGEEGTLHPGSTLVAPAFRRRFLLVRDEG